MVGAGSWNVRNQVHYGGLLRDDGIEGKERVAVKRFWDKVLVGEGCWEWQGARNQAGRGLIRFEGRTSSAPRVAWQLTFGGLPNDLYVLHHCDNPGCVRPDHLWLGTQTDNMADAKAKGRVRVGHGREVICPAGHPYDEMNTYRYAPRNMRMCRACGRERARRYRALKKVG